MIRLYILTAIVALAAIMAWLLFTLYPPRNCSYSPILKSCTWN
jgi:hypothetical protein